MKHRLLVLALLVPAMALFCPCARAERDIVFSMQAYRWSGEYYQESSRGPREETLNVKGSYHLYRTNPDGSRRMQLTFSREDDYDPLWSPDGRRILFERMSEARAQSRRHKAFPRQQRVYLSPNRRLRAIVTSIDRQDAESRVEISTHNGHVLCRASYASADGEHGFGVERAAWTPDSRFFVWSTESSGGHSPWHHPTWVFSRKDHRILSLDCFVGAIRSPEFRLTAPDRICVRRWNQGTVQVRLSRVLPSSSRYQPASSPSAASGGLVAYIHDSDVWTVGANGQGQRRLMRHHAAADEFARLATDGRRFVWAEGNVVLFEQPNWEAQQVTSTRYYQGYPTWRPGTNQLFVGEVLEDGPDGGLWLVDTHRHSARRVLPSSGADLLTHEYNVLSPNKRYLVSYGVITDALFAQVLDLRTRKSINLRGWEKLGLMGGRSMAWLDNNHLLIGRIIGIDASEDKGALWLLDIKTHRFRRWLYLIGTDVVTLLRRPGREELLVGLQGKDIAAKFDPMVARLELVNLKTRQRRRLPIPGLVRACQFSGDGKQLLVLRMRSPQNDVADAYIMDIRTGVRRLVAKDVTEAVWMQSER